MKTAGDILSSFFDERFVKKAHGYSKFFDSWKDITEKNGIAAAADHSRIKNLDKGIVLVEMDHPGWKQILQTKQSKLLNDFRIRFPQLDISGISLILGSGEQSETGGAVKFSNIDNKHSADVHSAPAVQPVNEKPVIKGFDAIKDNDFKETLKKLEHTIAERENM